MVDLACPTTLLPGSAKSEFSDTAKALPRSEPILTFSIVVPTRDRIDSLRRALVAIQRQTFSAFEVIIVDDGSSAGCRAEYPDLIETLDCRFRFVCTSPPNSPGRGPSAARNEAIAHARGEFIAFCDDDDYWCRDDHLEVAARALAAAPDADIYYANQVAYRGERLLDEDRWPQLRTVLPTAERIVADDVYRLSRNDFLRMGGTAHLNISIVRRSLIERIGGFWNLLRFEEDLDFYLRSIDRARGILYRSAIVAYHFAPDQTLRQNASTQLDMGQKWLARCFVCEHVRMNVHTSEVLTMARTIQGYTLRHITADLYRRRKYRAALASGAQAFAVKPGLRWLGFLGYLALRRLLSRDGGRRRVPGPAA